MSDSKVAYISVVKSSVNGEVISDVTFKPKNRIGGGFVISFTAQVTDFVRKCTIGSVVRTFVFLAHNQAWGVNNQFGYRTSKKHLSWALGLNRKTLYNALEWLKSESMIVETESDGVPDFMVNPRYVTCGNDRPAREREWKLRCQSVLAQKEVSV